MKHTVAPYVLLCIIKNNQVLMLKRRDGSHFGAGKFSLIGGKVEADESFTQAIIREAYEEVGITIAASALNYEHTVNARRPDGDLVYVCFTVYEWTGIPYNKEPEKHADVSWHSLENLPENMLPLNALSLTLLAEKKVYAEYGFE